MIAAALTRWLGGGAVVAIVGLSIALAVTHGKLDDARKDLTVERALHETDIANFKAAQAKANADHLAEVGRINTAYRSMQDEANRHTDRLIGDFTARVLRLPAASAAYPGGANAIALSGADAAEGSDRPGGDSVVLARDDVMICAANVGRLQAAHDWAVGLSASEGQ